MKNTIPEVFIIESLRFRDEEKGYYEGQIISDILRLIKKRSNLLLPPYEEGAESCLG